MRTLLKKHNETAYKKVMKAFKTSRMTCVCHPTGTGKSYIAAAVCESFDKVLILAPNDFVLDQVHDVLAWKKNVTYHNYPWLIHNIYDVTEQYDLIILDEFHRAGADEWGAAVQLLIDTQPQAKVLGTTATPVRHLDGNRNMADELFAGNVASELTLGEAMSRGYLPIPTYVTGLYDFTNTVADIENKIKNAVRISDKEKASRLERLKIADEEWQKSIGMPVILRKHIDPATKRVIVFCSDVATMESMSQTVERWFRQAGIKVHSVLSIHNKMTDAQQKQAMADFESDDGKGCRIMMSVNILNEGVHVPRVGAVLMLRSTESRILFLQQMGRCLTAANTERPIILDMVDNIKTVDAIHGLRRDFETAEQKRAEEDGSQPRELRIKDYTKSVKELISILRRGTMTRQYLTIEEIAQEIMEFVVIYDRLPKKGAMSSKYERLLVARMQQHKDELMQIDEYRKMIEEFRERDRITFDKYYADVLAFCEVHKVLPQGKSDDKEERSAFFKLKWMRTNFPEDKRLRQLKRMYCRCFLLDDEEICYRVGILIDFIKTNDRQPNYSHGDEEKKLCGWLGTFKDKYTEHPLTQDLFALLDERRKDAEAEHKCLVKRYCVFCEKNKRLPSCHSKDKEEAKLANAYSSRIAMRKDPDVIKAHDRYKKQPVLLVDKKKILEKHLKTTGGRLAINSASQEVKMAWKYVCRVDKDYAAAIKEKYAYGYVLTEDDIQSRIALARQFVAVHQHRPRTSANRETDEEEYLLAKRLQSLFKQHPTHPDVIKLKAELNALPMPECHIKRYTDAQNKCRGRAARDYNYKVVPKNECTDDNRYVIFYTPETERAEIFENRCREAGLEIKEWKE